MTETLRKHPPVGVVPRMCNKSYTLPETDLIIEKNMKILVPIHAIHHDPKYYPNPSVFDPDRFLDVNKKLRDSCTFLPFGEGPRICIGNVLIIKLLMSIIYMVLMFENTG